jgi:hypothetical protein
MSSSFVVTPPNRGKLTIRVSLTKELPTFSKCMNWWPLVMTLLGLPHSILWSLISFHKPKITMMFHPALGRRREKKKRKTPNYK